MNDTTSWTDHVLDGQTWLRFLFMLLFTPLLGCIGFMVLCLALFQFFSVLASGEGNPQLRELGDDLNRLGGDIVAFLTYSTDRKPFPFKACRPDSQGGESAVEPGPSAKAAAREAAKAPEAPKPGVEASSVPKKATTKKTTRKTTRTARRKTATRKRSATKKSTPPSSDSTSSEAGKSAKPSATENTSDSDKPV